MVEINLESQFQNYKTHSPKLKNIICKKKFMYCMYSFGFFFDVTNKHNFINIIHTTKIYTGGV